ncbi:MAG: hypothetical protein CL763_01125 [Chloroflexi bacterium]|nr:hypothetical protein [Chloroflexota bacterium]MQF86739.1 class II aldolase/adducin family protein [SAR202 cluster bacterium]|tara:strand:- start:8 stop:796 length:789 start_codon:yes stop_codon:yes gene_type:complete
MSREIDEIKREVAIANRVLADLGLATHILASLGHASLRVPNQPELFVVKGRGYETDALHVAKPEEMIVVNTNGEFVDGPKGTSQCYEVKMHSCIYRERPEVMSIVHTHPRYTNVLGLNDVKLKPMSNEGHQLVRNDIPVFPHSKLIITEEDGMEVVSAMGQSNVMLLQGHGAVTTGNNLENSVMNMLHLEEQSRLNWYALCAFGPNYKGIPEPSMDEFAAGFSEMRNAPHLATPLRNMPTVHVGGVWKYYTDLAASALDSSI